MNKHIMYMVIALLFIYSCATTNNKNKVLSGKADIVFNDSIKDKYGLIPRGSASVKESLKT